MKVRNAVTLYGAAYMVGPHAATYIAVAVPPRNTDF